MEEVSPQIIVSESDWPAFEVFGETELFPVARYFARSHPQGKPDVEFVAGGIAVEYLRAMVSLDWANETLFEQHAHVRRSNRGGRVFMKATETAEDEKFRYLQRLVNLAELLLNQRRIAGIQGRIQALRQGRVQSTYSELEVGGMLVRADVRFSYRDAVGRKGDDYDVEIEAPNGARVPCEAKCKFEGTDLSKGGIRNTLEDARQQLPRGQQGIVFLKIPQAWVQQPVIASTMKETLSEFLRGTSRVAAVVQRWEVKLLPPDGGALTIYQRRVDSQPTTELSPQVRCVLEQVMGPDAAPWISLQQVAAQALQDWHSERRTI